MFVQRKNCGSIARQQTVLKACTKRADEANDVIVDSNVSSAAASVDKLHDSSVYGDHLYCRIDTETVQSAESVLTESSVNSELMKRLSSDSPTGSVKTDSELFSKLSASDASHDNHHAVCSSSDETCRLFESTLLRSCSAEMMQLLDGVDKTSELDAVVDSEGMPLSVGVGIITATANDQLTVDSVSCEVVDLSGGHGTVTAMASDQLTVDSVSCEVVDLSGGDGTVTAMASDQLTVDNVSCEVVDLSGGDGTVTAMASDQLTVDNVSCEVVDLSDGRCVELECQCGAHYSDPNDTLHVVQCEQCHSHQHATCVSYDLADPLRGNYLCPHCRVVEVCAWHYYIYSCIEQSIHIMPNSVFVVG